MAKYITFLQLKAARQALNIGVRDIAKVLKVSKATISKTELGKTRDFLYKHSAALSDFFESNSITFPNEYSIRYKGINNLNSIPLLSAHSLTRFQLVVARYILSITQEQLAGLINVDKGVIARAEQLLNFEYIRPNDQTVMDNLNHLFNSCQIEFPDSLSVFYKKYVDNKLNQ